MPYQRKAEQERARWMTLLDAVAHISAADGCDAVAAQTQLVKALADGRLGPLKWEAEDTDKKPLPSLGSSMLVPDDNPPQGRAWSTAAIDWGTGRVRDDFGEYSPGKARVALMLRQKVTRLWPPVPVSTARHAATSSGARQARGPKPSVGPKVEQAMRDGLQSGSFGADELRGYTEETMASLFGAARDTCRKARNRVLVAISGSGISDK